MENLLPDTFPLWIVGVVPALLIFLIVFRHLREKGKKARMDARLAMITDPEFRERVKQTLIQSGNYPKDEKSNK